MPEPVTAASTLATWGPPVLSFLGNALIGGGTAKASKEQAKADMRRTEEQSKISYGQLGQDDRQFAQKSNLDRSGYLDQRGLQAAQLRSQMNKMPLADLAAAMLAARAGAAPAAFQARDYTRGTTPGSGAASGGYADTLNATRTAAQKYQLGDGGLMNNPEMQAALNRLNSMAGIPEEYTAQNPTVMRLQSELAEQMELYANATKAKDKQKYAMRITQIKQTLAQLGG